MYNWHKTGLWSSLLWLVSRLRHGQASCLLTGASTPPSREHPCPQPQSPPSIHFKCCKITCRHVCTHKHTCLCIHAYMFVGNICIFFPVLSTWDHVFPEHLVLHRPRQVQLVLSRDPSALQPLISFPPGSLGISGPSPVSLRHGDIGCDKGSWDPSDHHALG